MISILLGLLLIAASCAVAGEALAWFMVFSKDDYRRIVVQLQKQTALLDTQKDSTPAGAAKPSAVRKVSRTELQVKQLAQQLLPYNTRLALISIPILILGYQVLGAAYDGVVLLNLPFTPFRFMHGLTHRNLPGDDYSEMSVHFVFILTLAFMRKRAQAIAENRGWRPIVPKQASVFEMAAMEANKEQ